MDRAKLKEVWRAARQTSPQDRLRFLAGACGEDVPLRTEIDSLLAAEETARDFLEHPVLAGLPARIGPWQPIRRLGSGGMGTVYLAIRPNDGIEQQVAIKRIERSGVDPLLRERFLQERRILARLDHPAIAKFLDAGEDELGQPYLVMEYAPGEQLGEWLRYRTVSRAEKLQLFAKLCEAVHYAHQRLIVHRDLKPSNIVISAAGEPKLLDFGVAKILNEASRGVTALYATPAYAAPEQLAGEETTTAADVYSLGAVLFEMLAGRAVTPRAPLGQALGDDHGPDLAAIVAKALDPDATQRYASAQALREDVARFQAGLPVEARPLNAFTRGLKLVRRHRLGFAVATGMVAIVMGLSGYAWRQARLAQRTFTQARQINSALLWKVEAALRQQTPTVARAVLLEETSQSLQALSALGYRDDDFVAELAASYGNLGTALAEGTQPVAEKVRRAFSAGAALAPQDHSSRRVRLARARVELLWAQAAAQLRLLEGDAHLSLATVMLQRLRREGVAEAETQLAVAKMFEGDRLADRGQWEALEKARRELLTLARAVPGNDRGRRLLGTAEKKLGAVLSFRQRPAEALPHYLAALEIDRREFASQAGVSQRLDLATSLSELGGVYLQLNRASEALPLLEESVGLRRAAYQLDRGSARVKFALSNALLRLGRARFAAGSVGDSAFEEAAAVASAAPANHQQLARILAAHAETLRRDPRRPSMVREALALFATIERDGGMDAQLRAEWEALKQRHRQR